MVFIGCSKIPIKINAKIEITIGEEKPILQSLFLIYTGKTFWHVATGCNIKF